MQNIIHVCDLIQYEVINRGNGSICDHQQGKWSGLVGPPLEPTTGGSVVHNLTEDSVVVRLTVVVVPKLTGHPAVPKMGYKMIQAGLSVDLQKVGRRERRD